MIRLITSLPGWIWGALGFVATILGAFLKGGAREREKAAHKEATEYVETRKAMDNAKNNLPGDADGSREWLRNRANKR